MLNLHDLLVLLQALPVVDVDNEDLNLVRKKLECLRDQMELQEKFQESSLAIRKRMEELSK